jgi:quercetin dioxygenase-like cupin family protein
MKHRRPSFAAIAFALLAGVWGTQDSSAQAPAGFKRVELQRHDLSTPGREVVVARGEFQAGAMAPKHTHPGEEIGYVLEGELTVELEGKPPLKLKAGDTFFVPLGTVHSAKNAGKGQALVLSTYTVEKNQPLATPVK